MKISIIIPAYNCKEYIAKCIDSVLSQNGAELEVIVVNDGSTDGTEKVLEAYKNDVSIITTPNCGGSAARNRGIDAVTGDYVMFLDSDDYLSENAIQILADVIAKTDADIVKFRYQLVFPDGSTKHAYNQFDEYEIIEKNEFRKRIYPHFINGIRLNSACVGIYRSSLIKGRAFRTDMRVAEDAVFSMETYTKADRVVIIPDILYNYLQTGSGLTGSAVSVFEKYKCNNVLASEIIGHLPEWGMNTLIMRIRARLRFVFLTLDKIRRILQSKI